MRHFQHQKRVDSETSNATVVPAAPRHPPLRCQHRGHENFVVGNIDSPAASRPRPPAGNGVSCWSRRRNAMPASTKTLQVTSAASGNTVRSARSNVLVRRCRTGLPRTPASASGHGQRTAPAAGETRASTANDSIGAAGDDERVEIQLAQVVLEIRADQLDRRSRHSSMSANPGRRPSRPARRQAAGSP